MTKMDTMFFFGIAVGIAIAFLYDLVAKHQRKKQQQRHRRAARAWKI